MIEWTEDLATGVDSIDEEHKEIFVRFNLFLEVCKKGEGREKLSMFLKFLEEYVESHFRREEDLMNRKSYPQMESHVEQHHHFFRTVKSIKSQLAKEGSSIVLVADTNRKLMDWLVDHIKRTDRVLGAFLKAGR